MSETDRLVERYVNLWIEPDARIRRETVRELWADDGAHVLLAPPREIREAANGLGFRDPTFELRGHDALAARVTRSYEQFIAPGQFSFRSRKNAVRLGDVLTFNWEMIPRDGGAVVGVGQEIL